jgi:hypothetical protein
MTSVKFSSMPPPPPPEVAQQIRTYWFPITRMGKPISIGGGGGGGYGDMLAAIAPLALEHRTPHPPPPPSLPHSPALLASQHISRCVLCVLLSRTACF